ncbi:erythroid differentiation-related factor 1 isoform X1 [Halyomorpha halys]|uniref:erythroid differentiation-related factor 1 isoform X1 n=1 Tax=Halyomorpha halys TaxID=286706 RepID=UPI0006D5090F|nr:erythroid differentiation-related factor 1 [Halyomorpha halys]
MDDIPVAESGKTGNQSPRQPVKSNAVVKYSAVNAPATFARLQYNTDLKPPPSNWLNSSGELYGLNHGFSHSSAFSSFRMANMFPDCVGEVDVVSDAENIKKLLKIPYSTMPVSMMVHRIENTLLIDEFDIHKHLLSKAESDWGWLKKFFCDQILQTLKNKSLLFKNNTRNALQEQSLVSKFLHYSLAEPQDNVVAQSHTDSFPLTMRGPALPEPRLEEGLPDPEAPFDRKFTRNVVWTFEDIQMLLGTDLPIFGGSTRPCISLRLRDATKPISVLTGIDYWLDNLMSNVPEVVMCYHLDGIVQKYELIKTEDLPQLPESKFSPKVIRDVAQNILSFLKANATKAGHTYWLFKGKNEDAVKLYDLTSLCSDSLEEKDQNPFTVPVGMLLYRVARNLLASRENSIFQIATIRMLLKNCLSLLSKEKYPEIVLSAHYMLSDVYIPCETDPSCPHLEDIPSPPEQSEEEAECCPSNSVAVTSLCVSMYKSVSSESKYQPPPPIVGTVEERCISALQHVLEGLDCLQYFKVNHDTKEEPKMANPSEAIPMPFPVQSSEEKGKRKKKDKGHKNSDEVSNGNKVKDCSLKTLLCRSNAETLPKWQTPDKVDSASWKKHLCSLLCMKACLVYSILVEKEMEAERHCLALKHICGVLRCSSNNVALAGLMLFKAGDCLFASWKYNQKIVDEVDNYPEVFRPPPIPHKYELSLIPTEFDNAFALLTASVACYKRSQELNPNIQTLKRLGNVYNEIGNTYNNLAAEMVQTDKHLRENAKFIHFILQAEKYLTEGLKVLEKIQDNVNTSLVMCNIGRLCRLKAHMGCDINANFDLHQKQMYMKAVEYYNQALLVIGSRRTQPVIWDSIGWELSTTLYLIATRYQENPIAKGEEAEREAVDLLQKALRHCDLVNETAKLPLYQFRAASLHYRIASLYHNSLRKNHFDESKMKSIRQLCYLHYEKSFSLFKLLENPADIIRVQLERVILAEFLATESKSQHWQLKHYEEAISYIVACRQVFISYEELEKESVGKIVTIVEDGEETEKMLTTVEQAFQRIIRSLIKLYSSMPKSIKIAEKYKEVYRILLKKDKDILLAAHFVKVIDKITAGNKC